VAARAQPLSVRSTASWSYRDCVEFLSRRNPVKFRSSESAWECFYTCQVIEVEEVEARKMAVTPPKVPTD